MAAERGSLNRGASGWNVGQGLFQGLVVGGGVGTSMLVGVGCAWGLPERSGGGILIYDAYPSINYNRFIGNGISSENERGRKAAKNGGAIAHYEDAEVEFDEDRDNSADNNRPSRTPPATIILRIIIFKVIQVAMVKTFTHMAMMGQ